MVVGEQRPDCFEAQSKAVALLQRGVRVLLGAVEAEASGDEPEHGGASRPVPASALLAHRELAHGRKRCSEGEGEELRHGRRRGRIP